MTTTLMLPTEPIPVNTFYPVTISVPVDMSEAYFDDIMDRISGYVYLHTMEKATGTTRRRYTGYIKAEEAGVTPLYIAQSLSWKSGAVSVIIDSRELPASVISYLAAYYGMTGTIRTFDDIVDWFSGEQEDPIRWLDSNESFGLSQYRVVYAWWKRSPPSLATVRSRLAALDIVPVADKFDHTGSYTGDSSNVIEMWLISGERDVKVKQVQTALKADAIRVATVSVWSGTSADIIRGFESASEIAGSLGETVKNVTKAAVEISATGTDWLAKISQYSTVLIGLGVGVTAVWLYKNRKKVGIGV